MRDRRRGLAPVGPAFDDPPLINTHLNPPQAISTNVSYPPPPQTTVFPHTPPPPNTQSLVSTCPRSVMAVAAPAVGERSCARPQSQQQPASPRHQHSVSHQIRRLERPGRSCCQCCCASSVRGCSGLSRTSPSFTPSTAMSEPDVSVRN